MYAYAMGIDAGSGSGVTKTTMVTAGTWVDMTTKTMNWYKAERGFLDGQTVTFSNGAQGKIVQVPATTCSDIQLAFNKWALNLAAKNILNPYGVELGKLANRMQSACGTPAGLYPENQLFWNLVRRCAINLDSRRAIPAVWTLVTESVSESWDEFTEKTGEVLSGTGRWALRAIAPYAILAAVLYFGVLKKD